MNKRQFSAQLSKIICFAVLLVCTLQLCNVLSCQNCTAVSDDACSTCQTGYSLAGVSCCNNSIKNCSSCFNSSDLCENCSSNLFCLANYTCKTCDTFLSQCATCANCSVCLTCKNTLYTVNVTSQCQRCSDFMSLCLHCTNITTCAVCVNNSYAVNSTSFQCQPCPSFLRNCTNCINYLVCVTCQVSPNIVLGWGKCLYCQAFMPKCLNCTAYYNCILCSQYYAVKQIGITAYCYYCSTLMQGCLNCSSFNTCTTCSIGFIVINGCSPVPGCISVVQTPPTATCVTCSYPQFQLLPINGSCLCRTGHLAGRYCTQIIGCISILRNGSIDYCSACNAALYFNLANQTCECRQYFQFNGSACVETCGDGKLFVLPCDDGNLIDGDGCSSSCSVEKRYACRGGENNQQSVCSYQGKMDLTLNCINNLGNNSASLVFSVAPSISNFAKSNLTDLIIFDATENCTMTNYAISNSFLYVFIRFQADVENTEASLTVRHDSNYIKSPDSKISLKLVQCNGNELMYDPNDSEKIKKLITAIAQVFAILTWVAFFVGSYSHRMIGVETLHTVQLMFITQVLSQRYLPVVAYFGPLNYALNAYQRILTDSATVASNRYYSRLFYSADFLQNISVVAFVALSGILASFLLLLAQRLSQLKRDSLSKQNRQTVQKLPRIRVLLYNFIVFPTVIGSFVHFVLSLMIHADLSTQEEGSKHYGEGLIAVSMVFLTAIVFFNEWKRAFIDKANRQPISGMKDGYVPLYLTNTFFMALISYLVLSQMISFNAIYVFSVAELLNAVVLLAYRPYERAVHTVGIIINQIGVLISIAWVIVPNYISLNRRSNEGIAFIVLGIIGLIILWSFIRAIFEFKISLTVKQNKQVIFKGSKKKKCVLQQSKDEFTKMVLKENEGHLNDYYLNSQILRRGYLIHPQKILLNTENNDVDRLKQTSREMQKILRKQLFDKKLFQESFR